ncbi:MAG: MauE/DoxX family redox-associated membrane protein [Acidobacteriota bacterium]
MENLLFILRILLVAIFGVAGFAKLYDLNGSKKAMQSFGVPEGVAFAAGLTLPILEIAIAISLVFVQTSWFGAIGAAGLLGIFIVGMLWQWSQGNAPDCHCFGQVHSEPVSPKSIIRNAVFIIPAIILILAGRANQGLNLFDSNINNSTESTMQIIIGLAVIGLLAAVVYFLKQISEQQVQIMRRIEILEFTANDGTKEVEREDVSSPAEGLPIGTPSPIFELPDINNKVVTIKDLLTRKKSTMLFFVSPTCNPCGALLPEIEQWQNELKDKLNFVFISNGGAKENADKLGGTTLKKILLQKDREVAELFGAKWTPTVVLVNSEGRIASRVAAGDSAIRELVEKIKATEEEILFVPHDEHSKLGQELPEFSLEDVSGKAITPKDLVGKPILLTYWSTGCGWCQRMLEDLRDWDKTKGQDEPNLIVVSSGDAERHKDMNLQSTILLDNEFVVSKSLGMSGTPSAVLINENGKVISEVAVGSSQIWALVGKKEKEKTNETA